MKDIQLVVFDMAGTTVYDNRFVHKVLQDTMSAYGVDITLEEANDVMGIPKPMAIRQLFARYEDKRSLDHAIVSEMHHSFVGAMIEFYANSPEVKEQEGASGVFKLLRANDIKVVLDTGFDRKTADTIIQRLQWAELIDASVTSDEVENGRPHPDMIFKAMQLTGIDHAQNVAKVGDTKSDMEEGKNAGCGYVVGVTNGAYDRRVLAAGYHTHLVENLYGLIPIIGLN